MIRPLALLLAALVVGPATAQDRAEAGLGWMLDACAGFFETGRRSALGDPVAVRGAGTCPAAAACAGVDMTFADVGSGGDQDGSGAVRVRVPGGVADAPRAGVCEPAPGTGRLTADFDKIRAWAEEAARAGRLVERGGRYAGCAWNGRVFDFLPQGGPMAAFRFDLNADAPPCAASG